MKKNQIKIWDNHNKQYLELMSIIFGNDNEISKIIACVPNKDPLTNGWYNIEGKDLKKISITGIITLNPQLMPKEKKIRTVDELIKKKSKVKNQSGSFFADWDKVIKNIKI